MLYPLLTTWRYFSSYQDPNDSRIYGDIYHAERWEFNSLTRQVVFTDFGSNPGANYYDWYRGEGSFDPGPQDYSRSSDEEFFVYVQGPTRTGFFHDGAGGVFEDPVTLTADFTPGGFNCFGARNATLNVTPGGLAGPFTYAWNDGVTTQNRTGLGVGIYACTITDIPSGAQVMVQHRVLENPRLNVLVRKVDRDVTLDVTGGTAPYTYLWDDGATTATRTGLSSGTYYCVVTDAANCAAETIEVSLDEFTFFFSRNPILLALDAGAAYRADPSTKPGLTFLCDVFIEPEYLSGDFVQVGVRLEQPADRDGRTTFDVQELLDVFLDYHVPAVGQTALSVAGPLFRRFYLQHAEVYGEPPVPAPATTLTQHYLLRGGLSRYEAETRTYLDVYRPTIKPFLTWQPHNKVVFADQPEFLYYHSNQVGRTDIALRCRVFFSDGSSRLLPLGPLTPDVRRYEAYCCPVGFQQLGLQDEAGRHVVRWSVWVGDDYEGVYSETRTYVLDREPKPQRRYLLFANSLGGMDTICVWGEAQLDAEVTGEELERSPGPRYDALLGDQLVLERTLRPVLKLASGLRADSREWLAWLQELLLSRRVLLLSGPRWLPGVVKAKTSTILKEGEWHQTLEIDFQLPREQHYTPRLGAAAVTRQDRLLP
ncbi:SprB repeat-containing protein [Hymenobacter sp. BT186]|uniref:SprB repeat-containing protein n=1 Tax=Hymenobacter telluris TaxID=2816474 RepID=A0A939JES7_9BACT|nr:SprB repeat-containing protein [Hymenobacter telluris]MBO0360745.1 SprB repeat-containing protein [Hymenobacter telluris]MBW3376773.1 SprB repeat-containing protein [Hymenobacter norwichensis]